MVKTVLANTLKVGDTIRIAEGDRKIAKIETDEGVVMTLWFELEHRRAPFFVGNQSQQTLVVPPTELQLGAL